MKNSVLVLLIVLILLVLGGWYYFAHAKPGSETNMATMPVQEGASSVVNSNTLPPGGMETGTVDTNASSSAALGHEDDIAVSAFNFGFSPKTLTVKKGDHVKITITNTGGVHDFAIDEFNVHTSRLNTGDTATVEFDATKTGTFQYYCSVGNHRAMGMWGTLTVTP
ncbi:MAG: cupredoxin domain-containing protein [Patescibacteria group bacterium]|nr:cupredoxin domain-containing protein [Patescibacteria group bacterium]